MKTVKRIKINPDKCTGCLLCEVVCSATHTEPIFSSANPRRSRIRVFRDPENDVYNPILAGPYTDVECPARSTVTVKGKQYSECSFCRSSCPCRGIFKELGSEEPLKCDMCDGKSVSEPYCVQYCFADALTYEEQEIPD